MTSTSHNKSLHIKLLAVLAASLLLISGTNTVHAPEAKAQGGSETLGGAGIALMFLGLISVQEGGPGYVDIVGKPCDPDCEEAKWDVSIAPFRSGSLPFQQTTLQRVVIPKDGVHKPVIRNAKKREELYFIERTNPSALPPDIRLISEFRDSPGPGKGEILDRVWQKYSEQRPEAVLLPDSGGLGTKDSEVLSGLGGHEWVYQNYNSGGSAVYQRGDETYSSTLLDSNGNIVQILHAHRTEDDSLRIIYQPQPEDLKKSYNDYRDHMNYPLNGFIPQGMSTNFDRKVYETVIPANQIETTTELSGQEITPELEEDFTTFYTLLAEEYGADYYDGSLTYDIEGWLYGSTVLPKESKEIEVKELDSPISPDGSTFSISNDTDFHESLSYSVNEIGNNWVLDIIAPMVQTEFEVAAVKDTEAIENGAKYATAQAYSSSQCNRFDGELAWTCINLLDYPWGKGLTTVDQEGQEAVITDGVIRGNLEITEEQEQEYDANPALALRGIFGNDQCKVTRPTEDPENLEALASTILPSDFNHRFPGQPENNLGPDNPWFKSYFSLEIEMEGNPTGSGWKVEDACDQAAVPLVCEEDEEPSTVTTPPTTVPTSPEEPTTGDTTTSVPTTEPPVTSTSNPTGTPTDSTDPTSDPSVPDNGTITQNPPVTVPSTTHDVTIPSVNTPKVPVQNPVVSRDGSPVIPVGDGVTVETGGQVEKKGLLSGLF